MSLRVLAPLVIVAVLSTTSHGRADPEPQAMPSGAGCALDGVRLFVADAGDDSIVELSVRVRAFAGVTRASCTIPWYFLSIAAPDGAGTPPTIALARTFVDHRAESLQLADGVGTVQLRGWSGTVGETPIVVAVRLLIEGTSAGISIELPRSAFPAREMPGARIEQRVKSARGGSASFAISGNSGTFESLGDPLPIVATDAGPANGIGPSAPIPIGRTQLVFHPGGNPPSGSIPPSLLTLGLLRSSIPKRALEISTADTVAWDELATAAYAAALHADPAVASLGAATLAWLGSGLSTRATRIGTLAAPPETIAVPGAIAGAIGDVEARLQRRYGTTAHLLPLGRPATFRLALRNDVSPDAARSDAATRAVARVATRSPGELARMLPAPLVDDSPPTDPPLGQLVTATLPEQPQPAIAPIAQPTRQRKRHEFPWKLSLIALLSLAIAALVASEQSGAIDRV